MPPSLETLISAAILAPSGDNTQPWSFRLDSAAGRRINVGVNETRDNSPMNAGQRMSRIAVGAAVENMLRTAQANGWYVRPDVTVTKNVLMLRLDDVPDGAGQIDGLLTQRSVNRRVYRGTPVSQEIAEYLQEETPVLDGVRTYWICERSRLHSLASVIGRADAVMFGHRSMRRAFLANVRFDAPPDAQVEHGLSLASLELSRFQQYTLQRFGPLPDAVLKATGGVQFFRRQARKLVESASGLCVIAAPDDRPETDFAVGRAMQKAWLALTKADLAVQPMMTLAALENVLTYGTPDLIASVGKYQVQALMKRFRELVPELGGDRPAWIMRFGEAPPPSGRVGRLPLEKVMMECQ